MVSRSMSWSRSSSSVTSGGRGGSIPSPFIISATGPKIRLLTDHLLQIFYGIVIDSDQPKAVHFAPLFFDPVVLLRTQKATPRSMEVRIELLVLNSVELKCRFQCVDEEVQAEISPDTGQLVVDSKIGEHTSQHVPQLRLPTRGAPPTIPHVSTYVFAVCFPVETDELHEMISVALALISAVTSGCCLSHDTKAFCPWNFCSSPLYS